MPSIGSTVASKQILRDRNHQLDLLRIIFATMVLLGHASELSPGQLYGDLFRRWTHSNVTFGAIGVDGFFLLSGFLIVQSWENNPELMNFLRKRALRIVPGYFVAVVLSTLVVDAADRSADLVVSNLWLVCPPPSGSSATNSSRFGWQLCRRNLCWHVATNCRASVYGHCRTGGNYPELQADGKSERQCEGCMPLVWRIIRFHGNPGNHHRHSHRQVSQPDAAHLGRIGAGRKLYGFESSRALLHRIWRVLSNTGYPWTADWKPIDEQSLAYRANAATHRRSYLSSRIGLHLSGHGIGGRTNSE